jgi:hypothetical protein
MNDPRVRVLRRGADGATGVEELLALLDGTTIGIRIGPEPDWGTQVLAEAIVDLLARVFPRISIECPADALCDDRLPPGEPKLAERLERVRTHGVAPLDPGTPAVVVQVGPGDGPADVFTDGCGWDAYLGTRPSELPRRDPGAACAGPLTAACRAAAHAYRIGLGERAGPAVTPDAVYWSALDFTAGPDPRADDWPAWKPRLDAVMGGAGSVGGAAAYAFARTPELGGELDIVDPQALTPTNFDRALLATAELCAAEEEKVAAVVAALAHHDALVARPHRETLGQFVAGRPREQMLPLTLCSVDSVESRRAIQDCLPLELVNAACNPEEAVVSRHRTGAGPCVMCGFMPRILDRDQALYRLIAKATNLNEREVGFMMATQVALVPQVLRGIESFRELPDGAYDDYVGATLRELWDGQLLYGGDQVETEGGGAVAVAAPWVTALAGFFLVAEALKAGDDALTGYPLGPAGNIGGRYTENPYASPAFAQLTTPPRWEGSECLCNSPRRRAIIIERYGLDASDYPI